MDQLSSADVATQLAAKYEDGPAEIPAAALTVVDFTETEPAADIDIDALSTADQVEGDQEELLAQYKILSQALANAKNVIPKPRSVNEQKVAARRKANKAAKAARKKNR